jgi:hypothetical protein
LTNYGLNSTNQIGNKPRQIKLRRSFRNYTCGLNFNYIYEKGNDL